MAYENRSGEDAEVLPPDLIVRRAIALDAARHLSVRGRYPRLLALPDRWSSWLFSAVPAGLRLIVRHRLQVVWSTYPLATAHLIGWTLHRLTGLPWIADFRDPMVEHIDETWYPRDAAVRRSRLCIERRVAAAASAATFCTATARDIFLERHGCDPARCAVIENGFDEVEFEAASRLPAKRDPSLLLLLHSGTLYPGPDRDPSALLEATARLRRRGGIPTHFRIILRATNFDHVYRPVIERLGLQDIVDLAPALSHREALREVMDADGLLLFQGHTSNPAIPAKAYEYLRAARPILALVAEDGETAALLRRMRVGTLAPIADSHAVERALEEFVAGIARGVHRVLTPHESASLSRKHGVAEFARLFDRIADSAPGGTKV